MNVTLPEKEKIKKRTLFIYITVAIICILAIIVVVGIQILGNDFIDNLFGISKIVNKTEQQELELKANFEHLFNNTIEIKSEYKTQKIDDTKEIIYTGYEKEEQSSTNYQLNVKIPYINIKNKYAQEYNQKIKNIFEAKAEEISQNNKNNIIYNVKYQASIQRNILSLIIYSNLKQNTNAQRVIIQTFNYNLETNKELNLQEILKIYNFNTNNVQEKINNDILQEHKKSEDLKSLGYNVFTRDINNDIYKIENTTEFFIHNNNLYLIYAYGNNSITSELDLIII